MSKRAGGSAPRWPLERVKQVASRANGLLLKRTSALDHFSTRTLAYNAATRLLDRLSLSAYAQTITQQFDEVMDVYGVVIDEAGWYLKLTIDENVPCVVVISLHPLREAIRTKGGLIKP